MIRAWWHSSTQCSRARSRSVHRAATLNPARELAHERADATGVTTPDQRRTPTGKPRAYLPDSDGRQLGRVGAVSPARAGSRRRQQARGAQAIVGIERSSTAPRPDVPAPRGIDHGPRDPPRACGRQRPNQSSRGPRGRWRPDTEARLAPASSALHSPASRVRRDAATLTGGLPRVPVLSSHAPRARQQVTTAGPGWAPRHALSPTVPPNPARAARAVTARTPRLVWSHTGCAAGRALRRFAQNRRARRACDPRGAPR